MKTFALILAATTIALAGCAKKDMVAQQPTAAPHANTMPAAHDYKGEK